MGMPPFFADGSAQTILLAAQMEGIQERKPVCEALAKAAEMRYNIADFHFDTDER